MNTGARGLSFHIGNPNRARIVLIDEVWFSPERREHAAFVSANLTSDSPNRVELLHAALHRHRRLRKPSPFQHDSDLLSRLTSRCAKRYELVLGNFEYLAETFAHELDQPETAILVSLGPSENSGSELNPKGPNLIAKLLQGRRPRAEILFITGRPEALGQYFELAWKTEMDAGARREVFAHLWMLRAFPVVVKSADLLERHLDGFFHYFESRFQIDIQPALARALILAQSIRTSSDPGDDPAHLNRLETLDEWEQVNGSFPLRDLFLGPVVAEEVRPEDRIESFKALFSCRPQSEYQIHIAVLQTLLKRAGITLMASGRWSNQRIRLPARPGALFCLGMIRFCYAIRELPKTISLQLRPRTLRLAIPMRKSEVFVDALTTRVSGDATTCFRDWLGGSIEPMLSFSTDLREPLSSWRSVNTHTIPGHRPVWKPTFKYRAGYESLVVEWDRS